MIKLGNGSFAQPLKLTAGGVNYSKLTAEQQKAMDTYVKSLGVPPGPPTQQGIYATPEFTGDPYPSEVLTPVEENQEPPEGWPRNPVFNVPGDVPGPPVQFGPPIEPATVPAGEGFTGIGMPENDIFYFHPDHLGSTSYITTRNGSISQHVEYIAFGEVLFEEHSSSFSSPYLFNGKELDRETNLSYYGARYLDMKTSLWLNVDPLAEISPNWSPYAFCNNNPLFYTDPTGMIAEPPIGFDAEDGKIHTDSDGSWIYNKSSNTWVGQNGSSDIDNRIQLEEVVIKTDSKDNGYFAGYFNGPASGEYGPSSIDFDFGLSSLFNWFSDRQSGYAFNDGEMKSDFTGDKVGKNGVLYGVTQNPWSPGADVHSFNPTPFLKDAKTFSDLFSTQLEIAGTLKDARNTTSTETKRDSITEWFMVHMKDGWQRGAGSVRERDSLINSPNGTPNWYSNKNKNN